MEHISARHAALKQMLYERRRKMRGAIHGRIRDGRAERPTDVSDVVEQSDTGVQGDVGLAVLQISADTLNRLDVAILRLDAGEYGICVECACHIAEARLNALPFAVRCRACEEMRETRVARRGAGAHGAFSLFPDLAGS